ncbi:Glutathione S-transferase [Cystobacter fuscus DSM 2262]|uniref:Glutathione S-transferase n=1 Tax=Cystobacter fuscus (strain ATCC 25194 / DSM 2262 / NBRC 100088 / M29) TaxID=1242864 RepID=S9PQM5_CYSF2|nr:glutathione S-transferase family protein [Cystobacter fuscus]EPX65346.1 Glutathione S-transferase [Cystobacter fuscus DSM 2262]
MARIRVSAFRWVPPFAQGVVREFRVRWALEEAGLAYEELLIGPEDQPTEAYRRLQPFGQVPAYEEDGLVLFESGAIVLHIAERSEALMPPEPHARARAKTWMFAALNTVEPAIQKLAEIDLFHPGEEWAKQHRPQAVEAVRQRLADLARWMEGRDYLEERFTAADLLMTTVLSILRHTQLVAEQPVLEAYHARCAARPAYRKAMADHLAPFARNAPPSV